MRPIVIALVVVSMILAEICGICYYFDYEEVTWTLHAEFNVTKHICGNVTTPTPNYDQFCDYDTPFTPCKDVLNGYENITKLHCVDISNQFCDLPIAARQWKRGVFTTQMNAWHHGLKAAYLKILDELKAAYLKSRNGVKAAYSEILDWLHSKQPSMEKYFNLVHAIYFCTWSHVVYRWFERKACHKNITDIEIAPLRVCWLLFCLIVPLSFPYNLIIIIIGSFLPLNECMPLKKMGLRFSLYVLIDMNINMPFWGWLNQSPAPSNSFLEEWCLWGVIEGRTCVHHPEWWWSWKRGYRWALQNSLENLRDWLYWKHPKLTRSSKSWHREPYTKISQGLLLLCCLSLCRVCYALLNLFARPVPFLEWQLFHSWSQIINLRAMPADDSPQPFSLALSCFVAMVVVYVLVYGFVIVVINDDYRYGGTVLQGVLLSAHVLHVCQHYTEWPLYMCVLHTGFPLLLAGLLIWHVHRSDGDH